MTPPNQPKPAATYYEMVKEFHETYGVPILPSPAWPHASRIALRESLLAEEFAELMEGIATRDLVPTADGIADLIVILIGTALEFGLPLDAIFAEVHRSNMSKLDSSGKPLYRSDGKVMKGPNFTPPNIADILLKNVKEETKVSEPERG